MGLQLRLARPSSTCLMNACAAAWFGLFVTTAIA